MAGIPVVTGSTEKPERGLTPRRPPIYVLLATFNGERFLQAQLESILNQEDRNWILLTRDDGSSDRSRAILEEYADRDSRIVVVNDALGNLGPGRNFAHLGEMAKARGALYFAFCDQDDSWHRQKLSILRTLTMDAEERAGVSVPVLAFSDLRIIDNQGSVRADSYVRYAGACFNPFGDYFWLIAQNAIPGCAMLGNRALLEFALPIPRAAIHHDWWFALCAAATGRLVGADRPLIDYRVHGRNVVGVTSLHGRVFDYLCRARLRFAEGDFHFRVAERQARALAARLRQRGICNGFVEVLERYLRSLLVRHSLPRVVAVLSGPVRRLGLARNLMFVRQLIQLRKASPPH